MMRRYLLIIAMFAISINVFADMPILETFENDVIGNLPSNWKAKEGVTTDEFVVVSSPVMNGSKALKVNSKVDDHGIWIEFGKTVTVVSVEFWIYPDLAERSATLLMLNGSVNRADAGPYFCWGKTVGVITYYAGGWKPANTQFDAQKWTYAKVVADSGTDTFDLYLGGGPDALPAQPQEDNLPYRVPVDGFDRIMFLGWSDTVGPAYVDDILVYEGNVRPAGLVAPVEPWDKAAVVWGAIKSD